MTVLRAYYIGHQGIKPTETAEADDISENNQRCRGSTLQLPTNTSSNSVVAFMSWRGLTESACHNWCQINLWVHHVGMSAPLYRCWFYSLGRGAVAGLHRQILQVSGLMKICNTDHSLSSRQVLEKTSDELSIRSVRPRRVFGGRC